MISDSTPSTLSWVGGTECEPKKHSRMRVQRARADVAVDDAERGQREREQTARPCTADVHGSELRTVDASWTTSDYRSVSRMHATATPYL